jgi:hypothetical protein
MPAEAITVPDNGFVYFAVFAVVIARADLAERGPK